MSCTPHSTDCTFILYPSLLLPVAFVLKLSVFAQLCDNTLCMLLMVPINGIDSPIPGISIAMIIWLHMIQSDCGPVCLMRSGPVQSVQRSLQQVPGIWTGFLERLTVETWRMDTN